MMTPIVNGTARESMKPWLEMAGILELGPSNTHNDIDRALIRLREQLPVDLDALSVETLRAELRQRLREQKAPHTARMIDAALAPRPRVTTEPEASHRSQATRLVDMTLDAGVELWHSPTGDPHITIPAADHKEHHRLGATAIREWLARQHHVKTGRAPGSQAIKDAINVLGGIARHDGPEQPVFVRVAGRGSAVYLDLGDPSWRAVEITPSGWWIEPQPSVRFLRSRGMQALEAPTKGASVEALAKLLHLTSDDECRLLVGWLVGALRPTGPYPLLSLAGEQGAGKSTAARLIRRLIDPHVAELRAEPRSIDDVMIAATRSRIVAIDNLSYLAPWLSDALCRLSTGGALTKRELYSDDDEVILEAMRPVILTSIADVVTRGDLLDRAIVTTLPSISDRERLPEAELWRQFRDAAPGILGSLLDAVSKALASEHTTRIAELPRMADWACWVTAAEGSFGWQKGSIVASYCAMRGTAVEVTLDGDPLAEAIRRLSLPWRGTATALLSQVTPAGRVPRGWPESPRAMSSALRRLAPGLRRVGIETAHSKEAGSGGRRLILLTSENSRDESSQPSHRKSDDSLDELRGPDEEAAGALNRRFNPPSPELPRATDRRDDGDGCDGHEHSFSGEVADERF